MSLFLLPGLMAIDRTELKIIGNTGLSERVNEKIPVLFDELLCNLI